MEEILIQPAPCGGFVVGLIRAEGGERVYRAVLCDSPEHVAHLVHAYTSGRLLPTAQECLLA